MTTEEAIRRIEEFRMTVSLSQGARNAPLPVDEVRRLAADYVLLQPEDRRRILPEILLDFLRHPGRPEFSHHLLLLLLNLDVAADPDPRRYDAMALRWGRDAADQQMRWHRQQAKRYRRQHEAFDRQDASAIVAFLEAALPWVTKDLASQMLLLGPYTGALEYWGPRSEGAP